MGWGRGVHTAGVRVGWDWACVNEDSWAEQGLRRFTYKQQGVCVCVCDRVCVNGAGDRQSGTGKGRRGTH